MTDEQILKLAKQHLEEDWDENDGWEYSGNFDAFVKFAREIFQMGYNEGYDEGWDSRAESEYTHSGIFGEPQ